MSYKLLVFDWDGTLADSLGQIIASMEQAIDLMALERRNPDRIRNIIGLGLTQAVSNLYPDLSDNQIERLVSTYRECYFSLSTEPIKLFPGVEVLIKELYEQDYLLAVATGKSRRGLERALDDSGIKRFFHTSRCADETFSKPNPQMLQEVMEVFGIDAADTLMIGDSEYDLQMANNANVSSVAVNYGAQPPEHLLKFEPLLCLDNLSDLLPWLKQYN